MTRDGVHTPLGWRAQPSVDASGRMWISIGAEIVSVDESGRVTTRFGEPTPLRSQQRRWRLTTDEQLNVVAVSRSDRSLYLFNGDGDMTAKLRIPDGEQISVDGVSVLSGPNGRRCVVPGRLFKRWLEYGADAEFIGEHIRDESLARWLPDGEFWVASQYGRIGIRRVSEHGSERARIERLPNRRFFDSIHAIALGPANGVAVLTGDGAKCTVELYDVDGRHLRSIAAPMERALFDGGLHWREHWLLVARSGESPTLISLRSSARHQLPELTGVPGFRLWTLSPDGREVWCARAEPLSILRFALPD
jgi:hypothetical protein